MLLSKNLIRSIKALVFPLILALVVCCAVLFPERPGGKEYKELTKTKGISNTQMKNEFYAYPEHKQLDIFLYAEDPRIEAFLVDEGEVIVSSITDRIAENIHSWDRVRLIDVLSRIDSRCACVRSNREVMVKLEAVAEQIRNDPQLYSDNRSMMFIDAVSKLGRREN